MSKIDECTEFAVIASLLDKKFKKIEAQRDALLEACENALIGLEYCHSNHARDALDKNATSSSITQLKAAVKLAKKS